MNLLYTKGAHTVYLAENNFESDPMVSMSSWEYNTEPITLREWVGSVKEARVLNRRLVRMLESNGYKLKQE